MKSKDRKARLLACTLILFTSAGMALAQTSSATNPAQNGQATSSTRMVHAKHHQKASDAAMPPPTRAAKDAKPKGSGPTSGR